MSKVLLRNVVLTTLFSVVISQSALASGPVALNQENFVAQIGHSLNSPDGYKLEVDIFVPEEDSIPGYPLFASLSTSLDGNGFTVRNLKGPLFQEITEGEVVNLTLETHIDGALGNGILAVAVSNSSIENVRLSGSLVSASNSTGGLAGHIQGSTLEQVNSTLNISASHNEIGGIVGHSENSTISRVNVQGTISGANNVGGIAGVIESTTIANSQFEGSVEANSNVAGGIAGGISNGSQIRSSFSEGSIEGHSQIGGLVGSSTGTTSNLLISSYSTGFASGNSEVGGLIGKADQINIENSFSRVEVSGVGELGSDKLGGLAGSASEFSITNSYASGSIESKASATFSGYTGDPYLANSRIGGLVGEAYSGVISNSFADSTLSVEISAGGSGLVNSVSLLNQYIGGLVGFAQNTKVAESFSSSRLNSNATLSLNGDITSAVSVGNSNIGGLIGYATCTEYACETKTIENVGTTGAIALEAISDVNRVSGSYTVSNDHAGTLIGQASFVIVSTPSSSAVLTEQRTRQFEESTSGSSTADQIGGLVGQLTSGAEIRNEAFGAVPSILQVVSSPGTPGAGLWDLSTTCNAGLPYLKALQDTFPSNCRQQIEVSSSRSLAKNLSASAISIHTPATPLNQFSAVRGSESRLNAISFLNPRRTDQIKSRFVVDFNLQEMPSLKLMAGEKFSLILSHNSIKPVNVWLESKNFKLSKVGVLDFSTSQEVTLPPAKFNNSGSYRLIFSTADDKLDLTKQNSVNQSVGTLSFVVTPRFEKKCIMGTCARVRI